MESKQFVLYLMTRNCPCSEAWPKHRHVNSSRQRKYFLAGIPTLSLGAPLGYGKDANSSFQLLSGLGQEVRFGAIWLST